MAIQMGMPSLIAMDYETRIKIIDKDMTVILSRIYEFRNIEILSKKCVSIYMMQFSMFYN